MRLERDWGIHLPVKLKAPGFVDLPQADTEGGADRGEGGPAPQLSLGPRTLLIRLRERSKEGVLVLKETSHPRIAHGQRYPTPCLE